jgi:multidrug efflux system membrane fusion protein
LEQTDYVTREQADQERAAAAAADATVQADKAAVATARFNLENTTIRAPIPGRTGSLLVRAGNVVHAAASTPLVVIDQIKPILVRFAVPGTDLPLIQRTTARGEALPVIATPGTAATQAAPDTSPGDDPAPGLASSAGAGTTVQANSVSSALGTLTFIDNAVDTTTGTLMLKATFANTARALWPGQFVAVSVRLFVEQNALVVPAQAVLTGQQGTYVYVVDSAGTAQQRRVTVERTADGMAVIAWGLGDRDQVVTEGQSRLTPGAKIATRTPADSISPAAPTARRGTRRSS